MDSEIALAAFAALEEAGLLSLFRATLPEETLYDPVLFCRHPVNADARRRCPFIYLEGTNG